MSYLVSSRRLQLRFLRLATEIHTRAFVKVTEVTHNGWFQLAPTVDEVLNSYILDGGYLAVCCGDDGSPIFYPVFTELGLCYTFNMLSNHELYTPLA